MKTTQIFIAVLAAGLIILAISMDNDKKLAKVAEVKAYEQQMNDNLNKYKAQVDEWDTNMDKHIDRLKDY